MKIIEGHVEKLKFRKKEETYFDVADGQMNTNIPLGGLIIESYDHEEIVDEHFYKKFVTYCKDVGVRFFYVSTMVEFEPIFEFDINIDTFNQFYDLLTYMSDNESYGLRDSIGLYLSHRIIKVYSSDFEIVILADRYFDRCTLYKGMNEAQGGTYRSADI
jgi:hypothetical protein